MTKLALSHDDAIGAFSWIERANSRALAAGNSGAVARPPAALPAQLDDGTTLLAYRLLGDRALLWRLDRRGLRLIRLSTSPAEIKRLAASLDADLVAGSWTRGSADAAARLYRELVAPAALGGDVRKIVVVPDPRLAALPFAALVDARGRFLIETSALTVSPSVGYYVHAQRRWRSLAGEAASAMVVGDPQTDGRVFPGLDRLPGAADEARRVARLYPNATLATGEAATRAALLASMGSSAVVHLAAHAMVDDSLPSRSALALAAGHGSEGGALYAEDIRGLDLPRTRTVVLAVCGSASSARPSGAAGRLGLAQAFLAADVPTVVAALWPVKDQRSVDLLTTMHRRLRAGDEPAQALRFAQLQLLTSSDSALRSPATWALFQALGG
jgi:CHAT domain-containing protein